MRATESPTSSGKFAGVQVLRHAVVPRWMSPRPLTISYSSLRSFERFNWIELLSGRRKAHVPCPCRTTTPPWMKPFTSRTRYWLLPWPCSSLSTKYSGWAATARSMAASTSPCSWLAPAPQVELAVPLPSGQDRLSGVAGAGVGPGAGGRVAAGVPLRVGAPPPTPPQSAQKGGGGRPAPPRQAGQLQAPPHEPP